MKLWTSKVPTQEGWYWIQYKGKHGRVICPACVMWIESSYGYTKGETVFMVRTARNDSFSTHDKRRFGWFRFGPMIEVPNLSLKATI